MARPKDNARLISLYVFSDKEKAHYSELAKAAGVPLSKFLISKIEEAAISLKELEDLQVRIHDLQEEVRLKDMILQKYKSAVEKQQSLAFLEDDFKGKRVLDRNLIDVLKQHGPVYDDRLMTLLGFDKSDSEFAQLVSRQLEILEGYGLVKKGGRGWKWSG